MLCTKCIYYAPLVARSYDLSKCLKLGKHLDTSIKICNGQLFSPKMNNIHDIHDINKIEKLIINKYK
jgi:hypothetical protein